MTGMRRTIGLAAGGGLLLLLAWLYAREKHDVPAPVNPLVAEVAALEQSKNAPALRQAIATYSNAAAAAYAVHALANVEGKAALPEVITALSDSRPEVRIAAASAIEVIGEPTSAAPLVTALQNDSEPEVRAAAAKSLGGLRAYDSAEALVAALSDKDLYVRQCAIGAVHRMLTVRFPYKADDDPTKRQAGIAAIRKVMPAIRDKLKEARASEQK